MVLLGMFLSMWIHFCWDCPENGVTGSQEIVVASSLYILLKSLTECFHLSTYVSSSKAQEFPPLHTHQNLVSPIFLRF